MKRTHALIAASALLVIAALGILSLRRKPQASPFPPVPSATASTPSYPPPDVDLPPDRFFEQVDGAEESLRKMGCLRLRVWHLTDPPGDLEVLSFGTDRGASLALEKDAGADRTPGLPGNEGWTNGQALYFRRGAVFVRVVADSPGEEEQLLAQARRVERALKDGSLRP